MTTLKTPINTNVITSIITYLKNTVITSNIATQADAELAASGVLANIDNTKILTPKGWRWAWNKALTLAWTFAGKINFTGGVNLYSTNAPSVNGDIVYYSDNFYGQINNVFSRFISNQDLSTDSAKGIIQIATQNQVDVGVNSTNAITPLLLRATQFNTASVTATNVNPYTVTLNSIAGNIVIPLGIGCNIVSGTSQTIILNNNKLTTTSIIEYTIRGYGKAILQGGYNVTTNQAQISVFNSDISNVTQIDIYFKILNP